MHKLGHVFFLRITDILEKGVSKCTIDYGIHIVIVLQPWINFHCLKK